MFDSRDGDDRSPGRTGTETLSHRYDWTSTRPSTAIVELVAIAADREPSSLEPLFDTVDPEALDLLIRSDGGAEGSGTTEGVGRTVTLEYVGYRVTVRSDGQVSVTPADPTAEEE